MSFLAKGKHQHRFISNQFAFFQTRKSFFFKKNRSKKRRNRQVENKFFYVKRTEKFIFRLESCENKLKNISEQMEVELLLVFCLEILLNRWNILRISNKVMKSALIQVFNLVLDKSLVHNWWWREEKRKRWDVKWKWKI